MQTQGLWRTYWLSEDNSVDALRGVDITIERGEFVTIMGPSGCGKSTLLNLIGTLDKPSKGTVLIEGTDTAEMDDDDLARLRNDHIGFIFQQFNLINRMSAADNVALPLIPQGLTHEERLERAHEALEQVGLADRMDHRPLELSGGQQQRVAVARALATRPSILLADEPTGALDSTTSRMLMDLLQDLNERLGLTLIIVTHDPVVGRRTGRTIFLKDGEVVEGATLEEVML